MKDSFDPKDWYFEDGQEPFQEQDVHVIPIFDLDHVPHETKDFCWCEPDPVDQNEETGKYVWVHRCLV